MAEGQAQAGVSSSVPGSTGVSFVQIPDHELIRKIGGGSYGEVWLARSALGTYRAVKIVYRTHFTHERPFEREFSGIQKYEPVSRSQDGLMDILQVGRNNEAGYFYYVMELADDASQPARVGGLADSWIEGKRTQAPDSMTPSDQDGLRPLIQESTHPPIQPDRYVPRTLAYELSKRGRLPFEECLNIGLALSAALAHLHKHGLVHRDIKPSNIVFVNGQAELADIGLVTDIDEARSYVGTEGFIPPEGPGTAQADIYSLGKVLYEMSTGKDRQEYPELPTSLGDTESQHELLELNEIVLKACRADTRARYPSADQMHADLLLLQRGRSIKQMRKLQKRLAVATRMGIVGVAAALLAMGAWLGSIKQIRRARAAEAKAQANERKVMAEAAKSARVAELLYDSLRGAGPQSAKGRDTTVLREILDNAAAVVGNQLADVPEAEAEVRMMIGHVYRNIGQYDKAEAMLRESIRLWRKMPDGNELNLADSLNHLASTLWWQGKLQEPEALMREVLEIQKKYPADPKIVNSYRGLARLLDAEGRIAEAETALQEAVRLAKVLQASTPNQESRYELAAALGELAGVLRREGKPADAEATYKQVLREFKEVLGYHHPDVVAVLDRLANLVRDQGRVDEAEAYAREAVAIAHRVFGQEHASLAKELETLAIVLTRRGELAEAESLFVRCIDMQRKLLGNQHPDLAGSLQSRGWCRVLQGRLADAETDVCEAIAILRELHGNNHPNVALALTHLADVVRRVPDLPEADCLLREALRIQRKALGNQNPRTVASLFSLAEILAEKLEFTEAECLAREVLRTREEASASAAAVFSTRALLGRTLASQGKYAEAELLLVSVYDGLKQGASAVPMSPDNELKRVIELMIGLCEATDRPELASEWKGRLADWELAARKSTNKER